MNDHRINLRRNIFKEEAIMCCSKFWVSLAFTVMSFKRFSTFVNPSPPTVPFPVYILCDQNSENSTKFQKKRTTSRASSQIFEKKCTGSFCSIWFSTMNFQLSGSHFGKYNFLIFRELSKEISVSFFSCFESSGDFGWMESTQHWDLWYETISFTTIS